ncbi:hypothetical protein UYSO10_4607 [Kosakonia radicincitans]|nr:hypothetical protein UYSO10_4607 [Kosakonia radicincitans]
MRAWFFDDPTAALAHLPCPVKDPEAKQRAVMLVLIHSAACLPGQTRNIQQRLRQHVKLGIIQFGGTMLRCQRTVPEDLYA